MGSWYDLRVDGFSIWGGKSQIEDEIIGLFQERDKRVRPDPDHAEDESDPNFYQYATPAHAMLERLDLLGFSQNRAKEDYERGREEERAVLEDSGACDWSQHDLIAKLNAKTYEHWQRALGRVVPRGYQRWMYDGEEWANDADAQMLSEAGETSLGAYFSDPRLVLRSVLEGLPDAKEVILDYTDLVTGGYHEPDEAICANARLQWAATQPVFGPIVLLTEGRSDTRVLSASLEAIAPHLADFYSFLEFEALKIQGSTDALAKMVRAFVGARVGTRMLAIFDNDAAGTSALSSLSDVHMPPNIKAMALPPSAVARDYPTEGPQGSARMDVNGLAASIELYLGPQALRDKAENLRPVRWTGYDQKCGRYQGAVEDKNLVQNRFFELLSVQKGPAEARAAFPDISTVIDAIVAAFANVEVPEPSSS